MTQLGRITFDTRPFRGIDAFEALVELSRGTPSWTLDYAGGAFRSRVEGLSLANGGVSRAKSTANFRALKTAKNIAQSEAEYDTLVLMLSGSIAVRRGEATRIARAGEFCLLPAREITVFAPLSGGLCSHLTLTIPRRQLPHLDRLKDEIGGVETSRAYAAEPLRQCLTSLASNFSDYSTEEASALFDASVHLMNALCLCNSSASNVNGAATPRMGELLQFIDRHLADPSLSAAQAAAQLGISERRVHQMFASNAATFGSYVSERRIRYAAADLRAAPQGQPIWEIACRWGFADMATFRKAFRRVLGVTPRELRRML